MLHKLLARSATSTVIDPSDRKNGPQLVASGSRTAAPAKFPVPDLLIIASRRCSAFFAEAAVLVLVFGILDYFMMKGRIELGWIAGALIISVLLLAGSIVMDFSAQRWIKAHP